MFDLPTVERRLITVDDIEARASNYDGSIPFKGHAAVFNKRADIGGMFFEQFAPGAFAKTVGEADVRMLINHDPSLILARTRAGTLRLSEDRKGLVVDADMAPTSYGLDLAVSMARGDVTQMSMAFRAIRDTWDEAGKIPVRTVHEAALYDVSPVTYPAYDTTDAALRSAYSALTSALGIDSLTVAERAALMAQMSDGDVDAAFVPLLHTAQSRIASALTRAAASVRVRVDVPSYISTNAERGLAWNADGLAGDGLTDGTVREARELADGSVTEDKVRRMSAWFARHLVDLNRPQNSNPDNEEYPGPGAVAWALWGGSPTNPRQAMDWADAKVAALDIDESALTRAAVAPALSEVVPQQHTTTIELRRRRLVLLSRQLAIN